jgi:lysophospholipase L1-like esterase
MTAGYGQTTNFNLPLYQDNTPADLRDGYNNSMRVIDDNMLSITTGVNRANKNLAALGADTPEKAATLATDIANGNTAHHLLSHMGIVDDTSAGEHINAIEQNHTDTQNNTNALTALGAETVDKATNLKNTINTNTSSLTALGAETPDKATALKNTINRTPTLITNNRNLPKNAKIVCIGDSYGEGYQATNKTTDNPYAVMGRTLHATIYNYSDGGAGFVATSNNTNRTFNDMVNAAYNDHTVDAGTIDYVMITGGQNDTPKTYADVKQAATECVTNAATKFPNAKIVVYPMQWPSYQLWETTFTTYAAIMDGVAATGVGIAVPNGYEFFQGHPELFSTDQKHPNTNGYKALGNKYASVLMGGTGDTYNAGKITTSAATNVTLDTQAMAIATNGMLSIHMHVKPNNSHTGYKAGDKIAFLPKFAKLNQATTGYFTAVTNSGKMVVLGINNEDISANPTIFTPFGVEKSEIFVNTTIPLFS